MGERELASKSPADAVSTYNLCLSAKESNWAQRGELEDMWFGHILPVIGRQPGPAVGGQPSPAVGGQPAGGGQPAQPAVGGNMYLQIDLPHAFVHGDGLGVRYVSELSTDQKVLQEQSCWELLCYLVVFRASTCPLAPKLFHRWAAESAGVSDEGR